MLHKANTKSLVFWVLVGCIFVTQMDLAPVSADSKAIFLRSPIVDSVKRAQIRLSHVRSSIEMQYDIDKTDSIKLARITVTTYDREGNAVVVVSRGLVHHTYDSTTFIYDSVGNILQGVEHDSSGSVTGSDIHTFDHRGKLLESRYLDKKGDLWYRQTYSYDAAGRRTQWTSWARDWSSHRQTRIYAYDSLGHCIRDSSNIEIVEATYDKDHTVVTQKTIRGSDTSYSVFHYSNDPLQKSVSRESNGKAEFRSLKLHDSAGRLTEEREEDYSRKTLMVSEHSYDDGGSTSRARLTDSLGVVTFTASRRYDTKNNLLESVNYDNSGDLRNRQTNKFDDKGNIVLNERFSKFESWGRQYRWHYLSRWVYQYYEQ